MYTISAVMVQIPDLRRFSDIALSELGEITWKLAGPHLNDGDQVVAGIKGFMMREEASIGDFDSSAEEVPARPRSTTGDSQTEQAFAEFFATAETRAPGEGERGALYSANAKSRVKEPPAISVSILSY